MNILHLSAVKAWGGGENHIENLCRELKIIDPEHRNYILCAKDSDFHRKLKKGNIPFFSAALLLKFDLRYVFKIIQLSKTHKIDLIHIHDSTALTLAVMATKLAELPPFILSKKTSFPIKDRKRTLYKYNHQNIKRILCVSETTKKITAEKIDDTSKLVTIYHGTNFNKSTNTAFQIRERFQIPKGKILVGMVANHIRAKNLESFVELIEEVVHNRGQKHFHFIQIGKFTNRTQKYLEMVKNKSLQDHVEFLDFLPQASNYIKQFDISILTSQSEGIPQFIYESFYHKVPVVSTNVGGIPEIIKDGENALLSNSFDVPGLADKLIALQKDKELQKKFAELSFRILENGFTTRIMAEKTLSEYKKVVYG
ncbi:glycosyltransferase family 4 protein [Christiangramia salexigens]|uniref:Glycosyl transferase family 1 n=1 Tax=Christiangramia salexigens TaxID=1913577 RepID=A0A1L3J4C6_9FLAO|nr:glycosyltransferase family 4 protein [Christiangramia salexigens]APG59987.1 glycosyl transferase family 1 [Christiangramia salexigens]